MKSVNILRLTLLALVLASAAPLWAQQEPLTLEQVQSMVRGGIGDETGVAAIMRRGISFEFDVDILKSLQAQGASPAFLAALTATKWSQPQPPLHLVQILALVSAGIPAHRVSMLVQARGVNFDIQQDFLDEVRLGGGDDELITALKAAKVVKPASVDSAEEARLAKVRDHVAYGAKLEYGKKYAEAEQEYRAALLLDPRDADIYMSLAYVLHKENKLDNSEAAAREAIRLNPKSDEAHFILASTLGTKGDNDGAIAE